MASQIQTIPPERVASFCRKWKVRELSLFGSQARDDVRPDSDVDLLVSFDADAPWSLFDLVVMRDELIEIFGREVDLIEEGGLRNPFLRRAILRDKRVIYAA